ncbi:MAG: DNA-processing protein DprA [Steroidobacterales bacterium]
MTGPTSTIDEQTAWIRLATLPGLDIAAVSHAVAEAGSAAALVRTPAQKLGELAVPPAAAARFGSLGKLDVEADLAWLEGDNRHLISCMSPAYPPLLAQTVGAPLALYVEGNPAVLNEPQLAIVGSRNPTAAGRETAHAFAEFLGATGLTITSGLAEGIDGAAHRGALAGGACTIAVCATGLDLVFPREHAGLAREIAGRGALVSEFPIGTPARRANFPQRNRIISGLSLGALVVEAARRSGSLITARLAGEQGREVFAIPGSIHNPLARGCHALIRQGAKLVESAEDVLAELPALAAAHGQIRSPAVKVRAEIAADELDKDYKILLDALGFEPASIDTLAERTEFSAEAVASMLLILELKGLVAAGAGGFYGRVHARR